MEWDNALRLIYYDPKDSGSFGGVDRLFQRAKESIPGIKREDVDKFLNKEHAYTLHKPYRRRFERNKTIVGSIDKQWQADLADMTQLGRVNNGYRYLLTCIDCFSKYAWVIPVKTKSAEDMVEAIKKLLKTAHPRKPQRMQTDKGKEFLNSKVQAIFNKEGIHHFQSESELKAALVERFNRTLKSKIWRYFTANNTNQFLKVLPDIVSSYNHSIHRSIGMRPVDVKVEDELKIFQRLYPDYGKNGPNSVAPDDSVRISKAKQVFDKGYLPNWTEEVFKVTGDVPNKKRVYKLTDTLGEPIKGVFYPEEIQKVTTVEGGVYQIEKVIRKKKTLKGVELFVKWKGWPTKFNSWIKQSELVSHAK